MDFKFEVPSKWLIFGPPNSGKTTFTKKLLNNQQMYFKKPFQRCVWVYGTVEQKPANCETYTNISKELITSFDSKINNCLVLDDVMNQAANNPIVSDLFTKFSRHKNITIIFLIQNLFPKSKYMCDISRCVDHLVLMKNPRDLLQIQILERQVYGKASKFLQNAFKDATESKAHSYLLLDFALNTPKELRVRTNIFIEEWPTIVYLQ
jgi:adenylate kinase family enzyme